MLEHISRASKEIIIETNQNFLLSKLFAHALFNICRLLRTNSYRTLNLSINYELSSYKTMKGVKNGNTIQKNGFFNKIFTIN